MVPMFTSVAYGPGFYCVHFSPSSTFYILSGKAQARFTLLRVLLGDSSKLPFISPTNQFQTLRTARLVLSQWLCFFIPNFCIANNHVSGAVCSDKNNLRRSLFWSTVWLQFELADPTWTRPQSWSRGRWTGPGFVFPFYPVQQSGWVVPPQLA